MYFFRRTFTRESWCSSGSSRRTFSNNEDKLGNWLAAISSSSKCSFEYCCCCCWTFWALLQQCHLQQCLCHSLIDDDSLALGLSLSLLLPLATARNSFNPEAQKESFFSLDPKPGKWVSLSHSSLTRSLQWQLFSISSLYLIVLPALHCSLGVPHCCSSSLIVIEVAEVRVNCLCPLFLFLLVDQLTISLPF